MSDEQLVTKGAVKKWFRLKLKHLEEEYAKLHRSMDGRKIKFDTTELEEAIDSLPAEKVTNREDIKEMQIKAKAWDKLQQHLRDSRFEVARGSVLSVMALELKNARDAQAAPEKGDEKDGGVVSE